MSHSITALVLQGGYDENISKQFDLIGIELGFDLTLFHVEHYFTACWQKLKNCSGTFELETPSSLIVPNEIVIHHLLAECSVNQPPKYAIIVTDYFGGVGNQFGQVFDGLDLIDTPGNTINAALQILGVEAQQDGDEFETVNLPAIRSNPEWLDKYFDLAIELDV